jgi:hypothetical protein
LAGAPNSEVANMSQVLSHMTALLIAYQTNGNMFYIFDTADTLNDTPLVSFSAGVEVLKMDFTLNTFYFVAITPAKQTLVFDALGEGLVDSTNTPENGVDIIT